MADPVDDDASADQLDAPGLSSARIEEIRDRFNALNPYDPTVVPDLLKAEGRGTCVAISAKRYTIYNETPAGEIVFVKASEHGLGQLLDPLDPDAPVIKGRSGARPWIEDTWHAIIRSITTGEQLRQLLPDWAHNPAHARITISSPRLLKPFATWNTAKAYSDQIKPANFMVSATIDPTHLPPDNLPGRTRLVAPYQRNASRETPWRNLYDPDVPVQVTTEASVKVNDRIRIKTYAHIISEYAFHPEAKFLDSTSVPCHRGSRGLLHCDHVHATQWAIIGKEANHLDEVQSGFATPTEVTTVYDDGTEAYLRDHVLPTLAHFSGRVLAELAGCDRRTLDRIRAGQKPRRELYRRLVDLADSDEVLASWTRTLG